MEGCEGDLGLAERGVVEDGLVGEDLWDKVSGLGIEAERG